MKEIFAKYTNVIKYFFIGLSAAALDVAIYFVLFNIYDLSALSSTSISVTTATIYAFTLNKIYNFQVKDKTLIRFLSYSLVSGVGLLISLSSLHIFTDIKGYDGNLIKIFSLPLIFIVQYLLNKKITFGSFDKSNSEIKFKETLNKNSTNNKVAVIGAGFSGLTAAYELAKKGHKVTIFEFNDHLGGLASAFDLGGYPIERAYHFLYQSDEDLLRLAEELGFRDKIDFYPSAIKYFYHGKHYSFTTPIDLVRFTPLSFINRIRLGVVSLYLKQVKNWRPLSTITAYDWLNKWMGESVTKEIWEPLLRGKFNIYYDKITMSWLWGRLNIRARSQNKDFSGEKLGYPKGSFGIVVDALVRELSKFKAEVKLNTGIKSISKVSSEKKVNITTYSGESFEFDGVICTTPSPVFAKLIAGNSDVSPDYLAKLNSVNYLDAVVMVFRTTQEITSTFWYNIKDERVPFLTLLSTSALAGKEQFGGSNVYFVGAYVPRDHRYMTDDCDVIGEWKEGLKVMFPDLDLNQIQELKLSKFKDAQHIVDIGYEENKLVPFETPISGLYLANFSQIYPDDRGTNFAIRDGIKAAKELAEFLKAV